MSTRRRQLLANSGITGALLLALLGAGSENHVFPHLFPVVNTVQLPLELYGKVADPSGAGVAQALVALVEEGRRSIQVTADQDGQFRMRVPPSLLLPERRDRISLLVERVGFEDFRLEGVLAEQMPLDIELTYRPLPLPGLTAEAKMLACGELEDDPEARWLWETSASRHPGGLDTLGIASYTMSRTDTLPGKSAGTAPELIQMEAGQRGSAPIRRLSWNRTLDRQGYAFPVRRATREGSFGSWSYAPLEADFSPHFGDEGFGRRHRFRVSDGRAGGWVLRFCARNDRRPHIEGWIELGADTLMRRAEWRFVTPDPDENAGGWVRFPEPAGSEAPFLLPTESMVWAKLGEGRTVRRAQWYEGWLLTQGDSVPFLPRR